MTGKVQVPTLGQSPCRRCSTVSATSICAVARQARSTLQISSAVADRLDCGDPNRVFVSVGPNAIGINHKAALQNIRRMALPRPPCGQQRDMKTKAMPPNANALSGRISPQTCRIQMTLFMIALLASGERNVAWSTAVICRFHANTSD